LLDQPRSRFDIESVLGDFLRDAWHLCWAPRKHILVGLEEINEPAFLFGVQTAPDLDGLGRVSDIDVHSLGVLLHLENA
jgi:hypothetical protein